MSIIKIKKLNLCILFVLGVVFLSAQSFTISGTVTTIAGNPLDQVEISAERPEGIFTATTDENGNYSIEMPLNNDTNVINTPVTLERNTDIQEGISFRDLMKVRKFILYIEPEASEWELWQTIAADMNGDFSNNQSGSMNEFPSNVYSGVSTYDLVLMSQIILGNNTSDQFTWRFFDEAQTQVNKIEVIGIEDMNNVNFTGVKLGNIDCQ